MEIEYVTQIPELAKVQLNQILEIYHYDPEEIINGYIEGKSQESVQGVIAILTLKGGKTLAIINVPVINIPFRGLPLNLVQVLQITAKMPDLLFCQFSFSNRAIFFTACMPLDPVEVAEMPGIAKELMRMVAQVKFDLTKIIHNIFGINEIEDLNAAETAGLTLPNIKMSPRQSKTIEELLSLCNPRVQKIFNSIMERWQREGFEVNTTRMSIALDVRRNGKNIRIAMLTPAYSGVNHKQQPSSPVIALAWDALRKQNTIPLETIEAYQESLRRFGQLRTVRSSAYFTIDDTFSLKTMRDLIKCLVTLAKSLE